MNVVADLSVEVDRLRKRSSKLVRYGRLALGAGVLGAIGAAIAHALSTHLGPGAALSTLDIPPTLLARFSDAVAPSLPAGELPWESPLANIASILSSGVLQTVAVLGVIIGGGLTFLAEGSTASIGKMVAALSIAMTSLTLVNTMFGPGDSDGEPAPAHQVSQRAAFLQAVRDVDAPQVRKWLGPNSTPADRYVRAQLALIKHEPEGQGMIRDVSDWMAHAGFGKPDFTPSGEAAYAIDYAAYGYARSTPAKDYYAAAMTEVASARGAARSFGAAASLLLLLGAGLFGFGKSISSRVERIASLTGIEPAVDVSGRGLLFSDLTDEQQKQAKRLFPGVNARHPFRYMLGEKGEVYRRERVAAEQVAKREHA
jgi:type IV secretory pathway VirB2 component (pilin)